MGSAFRALSWHALFGPGKVGTPRPLLGDLGDRVQTALREMSTRQPQLLQPEGATVWSDEPITSLGYQLQMTSADSLSDLATVLDQLTAPHLLLGLSTGRVPGMLPPTGVVAAVLVAPDSARQGMPRHHQWLQQTDASLEQAWDDSRTRPSELLALGPEQPEEIWKLADRFGDPPRVLHVASRLGHTGPAACVLALGMALEAVSPTWLVSSGAQEALALRADP